MAFEFEEDTLFTEELAINPQKESILMGLKPIRKERQKSLKEIYSAYLVDSDFEKIGRIIGAPDTIIHQRIGGGSTHIDQVRLLGHGF